jgi:cytochrome c5
MKNLTAAAICSCLMITATGTAVADDGSSTYKLVCSSCHELGIRGAPRLEDKVVWNYRIAQGMDALYASTLNGKCELYVKDLRKDLSDTTIKSAVDYMVSQVK